MAELKCRYEDVCADYPDKCGRCLRKPQKRSFFVDRELAEQHERLHFSPRRFRLRLLDDIFEFFEE